MPPIGPSRPVPLSKLPYTTNDVRRGQQELFERRTSSTSRTPSDLTYTRRLNNALRHRPGGVGSQSVPRLRTIPLHHEESCGRAVPELQQVPNVPGLATLQHDVSVPILNNVPKRSNGSKTPSTANQQQILHRNFGLYEHLPIETQIELARGKIRAVASEKALAKAQTNGDNNGRRIKGNHSETDSGSKQDVLQHTRSSSHTDVSGVANSATALIRHKKSRSEGKLLARDHQKSKNKGPRNGHRDHRGQGSQTERRNGAPGGKSEQEDTFYKAVESPKHKPLEQGELTPRTEMAGNYTRLVVAKEWNLLQEFDSVAYLLQEERDYRREIDKRLDHKHDLEVQREAARRRAFDEKLDMRNFGKTLEADAEVYKQEEEAKLRAYKQADFEQRRVRDAQFKDNQRRRNEEKAREKMEIDNMMNAAKKALQDESNKKMKKMEDQQVWAEQMKRENESSIMRRREKKIADAIEDKRLMAIQRQISDAQQEARMAYFANLKGKQGSNMEVYAQTVGAEEERRMRIENERIQNELKKNDEKATATANAKDKWLNDLRNDGIQAVRKQLEEQSARRQKRKEEDDLFGIQFTTDAENYRKEEAEKGEKRRRVARENAAFLLKQMSERKDVVGKFGVESMSACERAINKPELRQAHQNFAHECIFRNKQLQLQVTTGAPQSHSQSERKLSPAQSRQRDCQYQMDLRTKLINKFATLRPRQGAF